VFGSLIVCVCVCELLYVLYESAFKIGGEESAPVMINVKGPSLKVHEQIVNRIRRELKKVQGIFDISDTIPEQAPETKIIVNKDKASFYRLSVTDLATAAHISIKGTVASKFKEEGKEIDIRVVLQAKDRSRVSALPFILMKSDLGVNVPLAELVTFISGRGPSEIRRISQDRTTQIFAKVFDRSINEIDEEIERILGNMKMPAGYAAVTAGESLEVQESFASLQFALILSIVLVYMIMAAQFESYFQPFIIMFTLPLSMIGVAAVLGLTGTPISVVVLLGIILLGGIVVNNGIILIDFINQMVQKGHPVVEAVKKAGAIRIRPILMTAMTTILGLLPLALGLGEGSKLQAPMAIAVMGGLFAATFLTLVVIPAVYVVSSEVRTRLTGKPAPQPIPHE